MSQPVLGAISEFRQQQPDQGKDRHKEDGLDAAVDQAQGGTVKEQKDEVDKSGRDGIDELKRQEAICPEIEIVHWLGVNKADLLYRRRHALPTIGTELAVDRYSGMAVGARRLNGFTQGRRLHSSW